MRLNIGFPGVLFFYRFMSTLPRRHRREGMLDLNLFRSDPDRIRESQRRRGAPVEVVEEVILLDKEWRQRQCELDSLRNGINNDMAQPKIEKQDATEKIKCTNGNKRLITEKTEELQHVKTMLETKLASIRNLVHDSVPIGMDEADNMVVNAWGERRMEGKFLNHVDLVKKLGIADLKKGANVAGEGGCYLKGGGLLLNFALINFGLAFLRKRKFEILQTQSFMSKDIMSKCAQLAQIDEEFYKVTGEGDDDKYLIATSEHPLCAYHMDEVIDPTSLPLRYAGFSTCFRQEAGPHGRDKLGIFRSPQFQQIEQFCITSPNENESWEMHEEMLLNSEKFYQELNLPYQVVSIVSGALNDAASKQYDLQGWFPSSKTYRELVSCSNYTDYQARSLGIRYGQKKNGEQTKQYVHMLSSSLTETNRTICCILENYQREDGVALPKVLQPYMCGIDYLSFQN